MNRTTHPVGPSDAVMEQGRGAVCLQYDTCKTERTTNPKQQRATLHRSLVPLQRGWRRPHPAASPRDGDGIGLPMRVALRAQFNGRLSAVARCGFSPVPWLGGLSLVVVVGCKFATLKMHP